MESKKTIAYLNGKAWYRALKVVYFIFYGLCYILALGYIVGFLFIIELDISLPLIILLKILIIPWCLFWAWLISQIPKWIFNYIVLGGINPKE
jgi:hypothetical protein